ncbi:MAG: transporter substrate-binding protein [Paenibacillaceae bacterium]|nr:transporter substrate-binding protein [Paenibacillaceae bacterium]
MNRQKGRSWGKMALGAVLALALTLTGCAGKSGSGDEKGAAPSAQATAAASGAPQQKLEPVTLTWYLPVAEVQNDLASVEAAANKILQEKLNVTLKLVMFDYGSYNQKMQLKAASGEEFDLAFSSYSWLNKYPEGVSKGMFVELDDLLAKYAPEYYASIPAKYWDAARINGKIYGALNYQVYASSKGFMVQKALADKYGLDYKNVTSLKQVEDFLAKVKAGEPDITPFGADKLGIIDLNNFGKDQKEHWDANRNHLVMKIGDPSFKLQTLDDQEYRSDFEANIGKVREWYQQGFMRKDVASVQNLNQELAGGKYAMWTATYKPGGDVELSAKLGFEVVQFQYVKPVATAGSIMSTLTTISKTSKNPERAMMLLNLVNTDKELYNLLAYGIENKHYKKEADGTVSKVEGGGYWPNISWAMGNQFNAYIIKGMSPTVWEETKKYNEEAVVSPLVGFNADVESLKSVIANVNAVNDEMKSSLYTGTVDPAQYLPQYYEKLRKADPDGKIRTEIQKQLDQWVAANKK